LQDFYEDIFEELDKFGEVENLNICDNLADHLVGNVYVKFREEESAAAAHAGLAGRFYSGRPIVVEFSPVTDFRESTCRQYEENTCNRGGYCNFMHLKPISRDLRRRLYGRYKPRSRSPKRGSRRSRSRSRERGGGGRHEERDRGGDRERRRSRSRDRDRDRRRSRSRDKDKGRDAVIAKGMTDEERRAMIAGWNSKPASAAEDGEAQAEPQEAGAGGAAAEAPQQAGEAPQ
jgi:splicing factor U2AF subunit